MKKPKALKKGDTIGIVSPASPSYKPSDITRGIETLESMGYKVLLGKHVNKTKGFTAASEEERAEDINAMFADDRVDAIFVTQGGYGSAQLLDRLRYDVIAGNPKIFTGFSDITFLHLAMHKLAGIVSFYGPGMARFNAEELTPYTKEHFFRAITQAEPVGEIGLADEKKWLHVLGPGHCQGPIVGGNMTLVAATLGTKCEIDTRGKILLLEEVETEPWIVDHTLSHLRNAGKLQEAVGIVVGESESCVPNKYDPGYLCDTSLEEVLQYYLEPLGVPVLYGLPLGHGDDLATIPLGVEAALDCDAKTLTILENGVV